MPFKVITVVSGKAAASVPLVDGNKPIECARTVWLDLKVMWSKLPSIPKQDGCHVAIEVSKSNSVIFIIEQRPARLNTTIQGLFFTHDI